jgi:hypothetical protein
MIAPTQTPMERSLKHLALARTFNELFNDLISQAEDMAYHVASFHQVHEWKPTGTAANLSYEERSDSVSFTLGRQAIQYEIQSLDGVSIERLAQGVAHAFLRRRRQMVAETSYCVARAVCCDSLVDSLYMAAFDVSRLSRPAGPIHKVSTPQHHVEFLNAARTEGSDRVTMAEPSSADEANGMCGTFGSFPAEGYYGCVHWTDRDVDEAFVCAPGAFLIANETAWHVLQELQYQRNHSFTTPETARRIAFLRESRPRDVVWCSVEDDTLRGGLSLLVEAKMGCAIAEPDKIVRIDAP